MFRPVFLMCSTLVLALCAGGPVLAQGPATRLVAAKGGKKGDEAAKKAEEEAARKKAEEEAAAAKKAEEEAAKKKAEEDAAAAKKAEDEAAARKEADTKSAAAEADAAPAGEERFADLGFKDKYFSFGLPESASEQIKNEKIKFVLLSVLASFFVPLPEVWLPLLMWDPKPEFDLDRMLVPLIVKTLIWMGGHVILFAPSMIPYVGWACGFVCLWPLNLAWWGVNVWTERMMMLMIYDDIIKHPPEKKAKAAAALDDEQLENVSR